MTVADIDVQKALDLANAARIARAEVKKEVAKGADPASVVRVCDNGLPVVDLLKAIPRFGPTRAFDTLDALNLSPNLKLGGDWKNGYRPATERERELLAKKLEELR